MVKRKTKSCSKSRNSFCFCLEVKTAMTPVGNGMEYYNPGPSNHWQPSGYT
jgi:hypothetical protein